MKGWKPTWWRMTLLSAILIILMIVVNNAAIYGEKTAVPNVPAPADDTIRLSIAGDVMLGRYVQRFTDNFGYEAVFADSSALWKNSDLVCVNLECVVADTEDIQPRDKDKITLSAQAEAMAALKAAGIDVVSVANNHALDYGEIGLCRELELADQAGLSVIGGGRNVEEANSPQYFTIKKKTIAFIAFSSIDEFYGKAPENEDGYWIAHASDGKLLNKVSKAAKKADLVVVYAHWGNENYVSETISQTSYAHKLIDAGADIVIGSHPHVLQPVEYYGDGIIFYSLGNYVFDQGNRDARYTMLVQLDYATDTNKIDFTVIPMRINQFHPEVTQKKFYLREMQRILTRHMEKDCYQIDENGWIHFSTELS